MGNALQLPLFNCEESRSLLGIKILERLRAVTESLRKRVWLLWLAVWLIHVLVLVALQT